MANGFAERPDYADFDSEQKFRALIGITARRLREYPKALCSYSGGSDSDIMLDLIEWTRSLYPDLPEVKYVFYDTGLEMKATRAHVRETAEKYDIEIETVRPEVGIVQAVRENGQPFMTKFFSESLSRWQRSNVPLTCAYEFKEAESKQQKILELRERYPHSSSLLDFICSCDRNGRELIKNQNTIANARYLLEFMTEHPPNFKISSKCCDYCKKHPARKKERTFDCTITGERYTEGGTRSVIKSNMTSDDTPCFFEMKRTGKKRFRPLYYVTDTDKAWYKERRGIRYSDAYEVYGLTRTGCCGCPISYKATDDLELIRPYEPNVVKAAWNLFGDSYRYRKEYNDYKRERMALDKEIAGQLRFY